MDFENKNFPYRSGFIEMIVGTIFFYGLIYFLGERISKSEMWWVFFIFPAFIGVIKKHVFLKMNIIKSGSKFEFIFDTLWGSSMLACSVFYVLNHIKLV